MTHTRWRIINWQRMLETEGLDDDARTHYRRFLEIWSKADKNNVWVLDARKKLQGA